MREQGYLADIDPKEIKLHLYANTKQDIVYRIPNIPFTIELHWKTDFLDNMKWLDESDLEGKIEFITYYQQQIPVLSSYYNVVYLCFHGAKHGWMRLFWLLDIVVLIKKYYLDMLSILQLSKQYHMSNSVYEMAVLSQKLFKVDLFKEHPQDQKYLRDAINRCQFKNHKMNQTKYHRKLNAFLNLWYSNHQVTQSKILNISNKMKLLFLVTSNVIIRVTYQLTYFFKKNT